MLRVVDASGQCQLTAGLLRVHMRLRVRQQSCKHRAAHAIRTSLGCYMKVQTSVAAAAPDSIAGIPSPMTSKSNRVRPRM